MGGDCVTLVEDQATRSARRGIYCALYPLAEWVAYNWWFLRAHSRAASVTTRLRGNSAGQPLLGHVDRSRHSFRGAGEGFLWPDLTVLPQGSTTLLSWHADPWTTDATVRYLSDGYALVDSEVLATRLSEFVWSVLNRLQDAGIRDTTLAKEWEAVQETDDEEAAYCLAAARLGLDPYSDADRHEAAGGRPTLPERKRSRLPGTAAPPWELGWSDARELRAAAGVGELETFDIESVVSSKVHASGNRGLQALGGQRPGSRCWGRPGDRRAG